MFGLIIQEKNNLLTLTNCTFNTPLPVHDEAVGTVTIGKTDDAKRKNKALVELLVSL